MIITMIILCLIILLFIFLLFSTLSIQLQYHHLQDSDCLKLKAIVWKRLTIYKLEIPVIKVEEDDAAIAIKTVSKIPIHSDNKENVTAKGLAEKIDQFQKLLGKINDLYQIINLFLKKVHVSNFRWHSQIGVGDAALTGLITGVAWGVKGSVIGLIGNKMVFDNKPEISIIPLFQMNHSETDLSCMFSFKIGNAIHVALQVVKNWKGRN